MSKKKLLYSVAFGTLATLLLPSPATGAPVEESAALQLASRFRQTLAAESPEAATRAAGAEPSMAYISTTASGAVGFYVVNYGTAGGFAIVSGDDRLPEVIGYSLEGSFDAGNLPANVKWWLDCYTSDIEDYYQSEALQRDNVRRSAFRAAMKPVTPICKTKWNQDAPYYNMCPMDNGRRSVTGCVATAMAQIMKVHEWPVNPTGSNAGENFSGTTLDWANMLDEYKPGQYNTTQANAVALLMRQCGASVDMMYSSSESGAYSVDVQYALMEYFGYYKGMELKFRDCYSFSEWNQMVYDEISNGRPVYYSGVASTGGHAFVCDGYRGNDYFHFNWGWGGAYDGYFMLNALNPSGGGIGSHAGGYNSQQMIITGVKKADGTGELQMSMQSTGGFTYTGTKFGVPGTNGQFYNPHKYAIICGFGVKVTGITDPTFEKYFSGNTGLMTWDQYYGPSDYTVSISGLAEGQYRITPAIKPKDRDWSEVRVSLADQSYVLLTVESGKYNYTNPSSTEGVTELFINGVDYVPIADGYAPVAINIYVSNVGEKDYFGKVTTRFTDWDNDYFCDDFINYVNLPAKRTSVINVVGTTSFDGDFKVLLLDAANQEIGEPFNLYLAPNEDFEPNKTGISASAMSPNFANTEETYQMSVVVGNQTREDPSVGFKVSLNSYTDHKEVMGMSTDAFDLPRYSNITIMSPEQNWSQPAGYYYWMLNTLDDEFLTGPWPLKLVSGPYAAGDASYYVYEAAGKKAYLASGEEPYSGSLTVPATANGYTIDSYEPGTFTFADKLTSLTMPATIKKYGPAAFYCADKLANLTVLAPEPPEISQHAMPADRFGKVWLSVPAGKANLYKRTEVWEDFAMPSWSFIFDAGCAYVSGLSTSGDAPYEPYYVSPAERPEVSISHPAGTDVYGIYTVDGQEKAFWLGDGKGLLPALGKREGTVAVRFTTEMPAGVELVAPESVGFDVYSLTGVRMLRNATREQIHTLPAGVYVYGKEKVVVR